MVSSGTRPGEERARVGVRRYLGGILSERDTLASKGGLPDASPGDSKPGSGESVARLKETVTSLVTTVAASDITLPVEGGTSVSHSKIADAETVAYATGSVVDLKGHRIGNYRLGERIGGGGMGVVYLAQQDSPRRQVAIKVMRHGIVSRSARNRFKQEADVLGRLAHPAVAQVYEAGMHLPPDASNREQEIPFFAMEYVRGARTLTAYAAANHLSMRDRVKLFVEVCRGVQHGHEQGVIHRDLKPANILVNDSGQPKIIDYGVALCIGQTESSARHTETGQIVGTIQYMSPEQLGGPSRRLDVRSDVYSLGVVLYELMCRRLPYDVDGKSFAEATHIILNDPPSSPVRHIGTIDHDLETIVLRALEKDRHARFQSVEELIAQCEKYLRGEELDISPVSKLTKTLRWSVDAATRRWEWAILGIVAAVTVVVGIQVDWLLYRYTSLHEWTLYQTLKHASRYGGGVPLSDVRMISVTPATPLKELGESLGLPGVGLDPLYSLRPVYGKLLQRIAGLPSRPSVVLLDSRFRDDRPGYDGPLADGIRALAAPDPVRARVDVICALAGCDLDEQGRPRVATSLLEAGIKPAAASAHIGRVANRWIDPKVDLVVKNPEMLPIPGLALRAYMSALYPGCELIFDPPPSSSIVVSAHDPGLTASMGPGRRRGSHEIYYISTADVSDEDLEYGIDKSAVVPIYEVHMPAEDHLRACDLDIAQAFAMSDEELARRLGGKALVMGVRNIPAETFDISDRRSAAGMEIHASAIASMMQGFDVSQRGWSLGGGMGFDRSLSWAGLAAILGVAIGLTWAKKDVQRWCVNLVVAIGVVGITWASMRYADRYFEPIRFLLATVIASELAAGLHRLRLIRREHLPWRFA